MFSFSVFPPVPSNLNYWKSQSSGGRWGRQLMHHETLLDPTKNHLIWDCNLTLCIEISFTTIGSFTNVGIVTVASPTSGILRRCTATPPSIPAAAAASLKDADTLERDMARSGTPIVSWSLPRAGNFPCIAWSLQCAPAISAPCSNARPGSGDVDTATLQIPLDFI